jgi:hypothetical protein
MESKLNSSIEEMESLYQEGKCDDVELEMLMA